MTFSCLTVALHLDSLSASALRSSAIISADDGSVDKFVVKDNEHVGRSVGNGHAGRSGKGHTGTANQRRAGALRDGVVF